MEFWRVFGLLALILALGVFTITCNGDDDDDDDDDDQTPCEEAMNYYLDRCSGSFYAQDPSQGIEACEAGEETSSYEAGIWACVLDAYNDCITEPEESSCSCYLNSVADCRMEYAKPL